MSGFIFANVSFLLLMSGARWGGDGRLYAEPVLQSNGCCQWWFWILIYDDDDYYDEYYVDWLYFPSQVGEGEDKATVFSKCKMNLAKQVQCSQAREFSLNGKFSLARDFSPNSEFILASEFSLASKSKLFQLVWHSHSV